MTISIEMSALKSAMWFSFVAQKNSSYIAMTRFIFKVKEVTKKD